MRCGFHAVLAAILVACLFAPIGPCSAANCAANPQSCCAGTPQMIADCCCGRVSPWRAIVPQNEGAAKAPIAAVPAIAFALLFSKAGSTVFMALSPPQVHQTPPIVLRI